jgi:DNA-directed RNA polymerase specialized sigma24 family protein
MYPQVCKSENKSARTFFARRRHKGKIMAGSGVDVLANVPETAARRLRDRQDIVRMALDRAKALPRDERVLVQTVLGAGVPASNMACVANCRPRTMQRRFNRVLRRLRSESFTFVMRNADRWPPLRRNVAQAVLLRGMTQREAASHLGLTVHAVRKELDRIAALRELHHSITKSQRTAQRHRLRADDVDDENDADADTFDESAFDEED